MKENVTRQSRSQNGKAKHLSPELSEFLHMLTALEGRFAEDPIVPAAN